MFFNGSGTIKKGVSLRGRSAGEKTKDQLLEEARREREQRARLKLEARAATKLQAIYFIYFS